jgi:succinate dehydrogenase / fumarate reductase cytochrome b subunit
LNLLKIRQPLPALVSILHRLSGLVLFLLLPLALYLLQQSLASEADFNVVRESAWIRLGLFIVFAGYAYHLLAGARFLVFDLHRAGLYRHARTSAVAVVIVAALLASAIGAWLW